MDSSKIFKASGELENLMGWRKWNDKIPFINFGTLEVRIIAPFAGAMVRFIVKKKGGEKTVSVYLDCHGVLGGHPNIPYWEAYPIKGDTERFPLNDVEDLLKNIRKELNSKK